MSLHVVLPIARHLCLILTILCFLLVELTAGGVAVAERLAKQLVHALIEQRRSVLAIAMRPLSLVPLHGG